VKIILERKVFYFDGKFYRQKRGTAMGTKMLNLKLRYIWVSVSFDKMSVIMLLFVDIRIKMSKNGISILLLFTVKRIWSFKELNSDKRLQELRLYLKNQQYPEEIVEHGIQKALEKGPIDTVLREQVHVTSNQNNIIQTAFLFCFCLR
jgi:hypothetical protein